MDVEPRKYGYRPELETLVVHTVNDGRCTELFKLGAHLRKAPRLGKSRKTGDLMRLAGACINGGACGLIRQYTGHLTNCHACCAPRLAPLRGLAGYRRCMAVVSSCREMWH